MIPLTDLKLYQRVGAGTYGIVLLAEWQGMQVVVKKIRTATTPTCVERSIFTRELAGWMYASYYINLN